MRTPRTLTARLVVTAVALVAAVSLLIAAITTLAIRSSLLDRLDDDVRASVQIGQGPGDPDGDGDGPPPRLDRRNQGPGTLISFIDGSAGAAATEGVVLTRYGGTRALSSTALDELADVPVDGRVHAVDLPAVGHYRVAARSTTDGSTVVSGLPTGEVDETVATLVGYEALLVLLGLGLAAGLGTVVVRRQLRPLNEVAATADRVSHLPLSSGEIALDDRVPAHLTDERTEVGRVGAALNSLLVHVESSLGARHRSEQQVRQFVADASHELRTPLATIHGYAELSRRTPDDPVALSGALTKVETETDRMSALVEDLLLLARLDSGRPLEREEVDVTLLLLESVTDARVLAPDHHWRLDLPDEPVTVTGDVDRLHQVVRNLLGNARAHTPPGTTVTVGAAVAGDRVRVAVHDDGPGLPPALVTQAFERFTRGDSSRTRSSGGAGLGLSLVAAITEAHHGTVAVESRPGSTTFVVSLPR
ncbi:sensor histidine kinase [Nocardioides aurantiacus]|uniref:histidine kinase n=1 Tax=Nocardioides aurantiacus TaxID=86796 RepID=A0A3N2CSX8_9ACTN|nr:ATP-binding protein [Nocardioides aurantiacus]ROR90478.1 two-component system OmpR family sensor kinase [Nocardioides aurantiacus]